MTPAPAVPRLFTVLGALPTTAILFVFSLALTASTGAVVLWRLAHGQPTGDLTEWLLFCGALLGIERGSYLGKRATTWKPTEMATAAQQMEGTPAVVVTEGPPATIASAPKVGPMTPLPAAPFAAPMEGE
jgi:hypothetical protein